MAGSGRDEDATRAKASGDRLAERGYQGREGLVRALQDGSAAVRSEAAFLLGLNGDANALPPLRAALEDDSARVRVEAALALARLGETEEALPLLRTELRGEFFADAPLRAARALAVLGDPSGWPRVLEALDSPLPSNRMEAIAVLPSFVPFDGQEVDGQRIEVRSRLRQAAEDSEELLRQDARTALETIEET